MSNDTISTRVVFEVDQQSASSATRLLKEQHDSIDAIREASTESSASALRLVESQKFQANEINKQLRQTVDQIGKLDATLGGIGDHYEYSMQSAYDIAAEMLALQDEIQLAYAMNETQSAEGLTEAGKRVIQLRKEYDQLKNILADLPRDLKSGLQEANDEAEKLSQTLKVNVETSSSTGSARSNLAVVSTLSNRVGLGGNVSLNVAGDIIEIVDSLPDLKESLQGIPGSISTAISAIGTPFGIGMLGALGALALGIKLFTDDAKKREEELAKAREVARASAEGAARVGTGASRTITSVLAEGTTTASDEAISIATDQLREAEIFKGFIDSALEALNEVDQEAYRLLNEMATGGLELSDIRQRASEGGSIEKQLLEIVDEIAPALAEANIPLNEFIKDIQSGMKQLEDESQNAEIIIGQSNAIINRLTRAQEEGEFIAGDLAKAEKRLTDERLISAEQARQLAQEGIRLSRMSADELERYTQDLDDQNKGLKAARDLLVATGDQSESVAQQIAEYNEQIARNEGLINTITDSYIELARARELQAEIEKEAVQATIKYNRDKEAVNRQYEDARLASEKKLSDDLLRIEDRRIQQIERAQEQFAEREASINLKSARDEQDQQAKLDFERQQQSVKVEREELKAELDHARKVRDIREKSAQQEISLLLKRDFAGLFALRQRTDQEIKTAERGAKEASETREQSRNEQDQDEKAKLAFEREQRNIRYQREIADAHAQAQRTQQQARDNADRELAITRQKHNQQLHDLKMAKDQELAILRQGIQQELDLIYGGKTARVRAEQETQAALWEAWSIRYQNNIQRGAQPIIIPSTPPRQNVAPVINVTVNESHNPARTRQVVLETVQQIWEH